MLGLVELEKPAALRDRGGVWFGLGHHQLHIGVQDPFVPAVKAHPALRMSGLELDAIARRLAEAGVEPRWDESLPGVRRFFVHDPWGNRIELLASEC